MDGHPQRISRHERGRPLVTSQVQVSAEIKDSQPEKREQRSKRDKGDAFSLETRTQKGETICTFFNKGKCLKGAQCTMAHVCNYPGCFSSTHARVQQHPVWPPQPR